jgi:hypothetical protein
MDETDYQRASNTYTVSPMGDYYTFLMFKALDRGDFTDLHAAFAP